MADNKPVVYAGIVTFNPELDKLKKNIEAILNQVDKIFVVDNGSNNEDSVRKLCDGMGVCLHANGANLGIAKALKTIMELSSGEADWVLSLDQDSVCPSNLVESAMKFDSKEEIGILSPMIFDINADDFIKIDKSKAVDNELLEVWTCITSGSLTRVKAYEETAGYDETLFIDLVDDDLCAKIRIHGYKIYKMQNVIMRHELGNIVKRQFLWKTLAISNHSTFRRYYISRNLRVFIRKYKKVKNPNMNINLYRKVLYTTPITLMYEKDKKEKFKAFFKGYKDGKTFEIDERI